MITNRIFYRVALLTFLLPFLIKPAEMNQGQNGSVLAADKNEVIFIEGSVEAIPYSLSLDNFKDYVSSALLETFPTLKGKEHIGEFCYLIPSLYESLNLRWHCHPSIGATVPPYLPVLKPVVYKKPSPHRYFLKKEITQNLTGVLAHSLCSIISDYAENASSMLECTNGDIITTDLPNYAHKKIIATLKCSQKFKNQPFHINVARGLVGNPHTPPELTKKLQKPIDQYDELNRHATVLDTQLKEWFE